MSKRTCQDIIYVLECSYLIDDRFNVLGSSCSLVGAYCLGMVLPVGWEDQFIDIDMVLMMYVTFSLLTDVMYIVKRSVNYQTIKCMRICGF